MKLKCFVCWRDGRPNVPAETTPALRTCGCGHDMEGMSCVVEGGCMRECCHRTATEPVELDERTTVVTIEEHCVTQWATQGAEWDKADNDRDITDYYNLVHCIGPDACFGPGLVEAVPDHVAPVICIAHASRYLENLEAR